MRVCHLQLNAFRNYRELEFVPGEGLNILYGENAQGKSNILEALSLLATTRSLRANRESEMILRDAEAAHVNAEISREREGEAEIQVSIFQSDKKAVRINGLKRGRVLELLGQFNAVFFGSIDLAIVTGEPSDRRHYLNVEISQISPLYVYDLGHYKRVLEQRNRLLRELRDRPRPPEESGLSAWNEQLIRFGAPIYEKRKFYIERLAPLADQIHRELTDGKEGLEVRYAPSIPLPVSPAADTALRESSAEERYVTEAQQEAEQGDADIEPNSVTAATSESRSPAPAAPELPLSDTERIADVFRRQLSVVAADEARRGTTLTGPQRDDVCFFVNGNEARIYGSQGQQRTVALALKLAEFQLIEDYVGEPPVMLLDDVMSDLDDSRRRHLLAWVRRRCQTFITCTSLRSFPDSILNEARTFRVVAGTIQADEPRTPRQKKTSAAAEDRTAAVAGNGTAEPAAETPGAEIGAAVASATDFNR